MANDAVRPLLTMQEAAEYLGLPVQPLTAELEARGYIIRVGKQRRVARADLEGFIDECRDVKRVPGFISSRGQDVRLDGLSVMDPEKFQLARQIIDVLNRPSPNTSRPSTGPRQQQS